MLQKMKVILKKPLQNSNQMSVLHILAKSIICFLIPSHERFLLSGFENQTFLRLFLARGELVQNVYKRNAEKTENKKVQD